MSSTRTSPRTTRASLPSALSSALSSALTASVFTGLACGSTPPPTTAPAAPTATAPAAPTATEPAPRPDPSPFSPKPSTSTLTILHLGDTEAGMLPDLVHGTGGLARTVAILRALRARAADALVVHAGDTLIPAPELALELPFPADGGPSKSALLHGNDRLGVAAAALGNHDLDLGEGFLADVVKGAAYPYVASTVTATSGPLAPLIVGETRWLHASRGAILRRARACTGEVVDGTCHGGQVGVVGATPEALGTLTGGARALQAPSSTQETVAALQREVDALRGEGLSVIVLLSHRQGVDRDLDLLDAGLTGVDVIVSGGGEHVLASTKHRLPPGVERDRRCPQWGEPCYPIVRRARDGKPVVLVATDGGMRTVGELVLTFDDDGVVTGVEPRSRPWPVDEESVLELRAELDRALVAFELRTREALLPMQKIVGETPVFLDGVREHVRNGETNLGDASADALWQAARAERRDVVAAFRSAGGIRGSIGVVDPSGARQGKKVTLLDVKSALRFDSRVVVVETTHAALARTVEAALVGAGSGRGSFPQVSRGVELVWSTAGADQQQRVVDGKVRGVVCDGTRLRRLVLPGGVVVVDDGVTPTPDAPVVIATLDFLANGGDGWFPDAAVRQTPTAATEQTALIAWLDDRAARDATLTSAGRIRSTSTPAPARCAP